MFFLEISYSCNSQPPFNQSIYRSGRGSKINLWDNGKVPVKFRSSFNSGDRKTFIRAVRKIEEVTCIKFFQRTTHEAYVSVENTCRECGHCTGVGSANVGKHRPNEMKIDSCLSPSNINDVVFVMHEILHSLGLIHTHRRHDRNKHIRINDNNINPDKRYNFNRCSDCKTYNTPYDCMSVMHYRENDFRATWAKGPSMTARNPKKCDLRTLPTELTDSDIDLLNKMYPCV